MNRYYRWWKSTGQWYEITKERYEEWLFVSRFNTVTVTLLKLGPQEMQTSAQLVKGD